MNALIGDRFLKRFLGHRLNRHSAGPAGEAQTQPDPTAEKPAEPDCPPTEDLPKKEAIPGNNEIRETNQI